MFKGLIKNGFDTLQCAVGFLQKMTHGKVKLTRTSILSSFLESVERVHVGAECWTEYSGGGKLEVITQPQAATRFCLSDVVCCWYHQHLYYRGYVNSLIIRAV